ncbi:metallophosphoesterase family protein [Hoeflea marina]|uniref:metallophosphoesterase family protein n=1 Tax=Hoeflea marina TaxID=274592 RepID=UPI00130498C7|nr:metallophosphoesterase [Hoeflea marina]
MQIGDIHYPKYKDQADVDNKLDTGSMVLAGVGVNRIASVMKYIKNLAQSVHIDFAAFVGDFTDAGNELEFTNSLEYFSTAFKSMCIPAYGVPGNHDLEWPQILNQARDKFSAFRKIAASFSGSIELSFENYVSYQCPASGAGEMALYALNSCLGCSDIWKMSRIYQVDIESHLKSLDSQDLYSRFDAPYIDQDSITSVCQEIRSNPNVTPIILAHHNLLPQRMPRIAIFPEMLNAGYVRNELKQIGRPIVYLHGHIHDSLVESLLADDQDGQISIVAISAPLLRDGFNHVQLFTSEDNVPLGVQIDEYRFETVGITRPKRRKIRFYGADKREQLIDDKGREIISLVKSQARSRFSDLTDQFSVLQILELEFTGHLMIERTLEFNDKTWRVSCQ